MKMGEPDKITDEWLKELQKSRRMYRYLMDSPDPSTGVLAVSVAGEIEGHIAETGGHSYVYVLARVPFKRQLCPHLGRSGKPGLTSEEECIQLPFRLM